MYFWQFTINKNDCFSITVGFLTKACSATVSYMLFYSWNTLPKFKILAYLTCFRFAVYLKFQFYNKVWWFTFLIFCQESVSYIRQKWSELLDFMNKESQVKSISDNDLQGTSKNFKSLRKVNIECISKATAVIMFAILSNSIIKILIQFDWQNWFLNEKSIAT